MSAHADMHEDVAEDAVDNDRNVVDDIDNNNNVDEGDDDEQVVIEAADLDANDVAAQVAANEARNDA